MKVLILGFLAVLFLGSYAHAVSIEWDTVSVDVDGVPLSAGNAVTGYRVYACQSNNCTLGTAAFVALVPADSPQLARKSFNIDKLPKPQTYLVTAVNLAGESAASNTVRVTPPRAPANLIAIP